MAGGYMCGPGELCNIVPNTYYKVNASKIGYNTSPDYTVYAAGVAI